MIRKYENFGNLFKPNKLNIINWAKHKKYNINELSYDNKNISNNRNKNKKKSKDKNKKNLFKTINLLQPYKKDYKNIKQPILIKNNKNEINIRLNLNCALLNNINNINNIQKYNNFFNNQIYTNNFLNNSNSLEEIIKEKEKSSRKDSNKKAKPLSANNNRKIKNLSQINLTNLINNKCKLKTGSLPKNKSLININSSKKKNNRYDSEKNINSLLSKNNLFNENNFSNLDNLITNYSKRAKSKNIINIFNINRRKKAKSCNKNIKSNYNNYNNNFKNIIKKNKNYAISYEYKNIHKNSDIILSANKNRNYKTPSQFNKCIKNIGNLTPKKQKYKKDNFNLLLFDEIYNKTKSTLENFKKTFETKLNIKI